MILFTFSGNILPIYVLPGLPALALLVSIFSNGLTRMILVTSLVTPLVISGFLYWELPKIANYKGDKVLLSEINSNVDVYYLGTRTFSGRFYRQGKAIELSDIEALSTRNFPVYVVVPNDQVDAVKNLYNCETKRQNKRRQLLLCET